MNVTTTLLPALYYPSKVKQDRLLTDLRYLKKLEGTALDWTTESDQDVVIDGRIVICVEYISKQLSMHLVECWPIDRSQ